MTYAWRLGRTGQQRLRRHVPRLHHDRGLCERYHACLHHQPLLRLGARARQRQMEFEGQQRGGRQAHGRSTRADLRHPRWWRYTASSSRSRTQTRWSTPCIMAIRFRWSCQQVGFNLSGTRDAIAALASCVSEHLEAEKAGGIEAKAPNETKDSGNDNRLFTPNEAADFASHLLAAAGITDYQMW